MKSFKGIFVTWVFTTLALLVAVFFYFWSELGEIVFGTGEANTGLVQATLDDADIATIKAVRLERDLKDSAPAASTAPAIAVTDLRVVAKVGMNVTVGFRLSASPSTTQYPTLRIFVLAGRQTARTVDLSPQRYAHGVRLSNEQIRVPLTLNPGETGFTAQALPGEQGGAV
ncbi:MULTISPECIES: hypothetical protein [Paraburkholderia]|uniref:Uncharacterized protein n=1 Tax=Paraburkholderia madseniana TaxID=2599607 RepID=A0AAP5ET87_9BURK|nr:MULTISPECIES: hypothetical protein [Paraburkholderia]MCX4151010.1 hypothetical protein [Paraburkholderia madseniana]MCX4176650.1 hypothetical protein [Paraburkholderia madseniana]MDN7153942.1 hypothetical protein [Paraburkholderia sp. WS6]MDQ6412824.1 hypothetical protein [Paraburkholderia madseniana]MDQ6464641.1 hypothetical protein [Paraburkholderia madseniana]